MDDYGDEQYVTRSEAAAMVSQAVETAVSIAMMKFEERVEQHNPIAMEGTIMANTWVPGSGTQQPEDGTAIVLINKTASVFTDQGDAPVLIRMKIASPHVGDQFGPNGDERVHVHRTESGLVAHPYHGPDDTQMPPSGQRFIGNMKRIWIHTINGFQLILDDLANMLTLRSPGGLYLILNDATDKLEIGKDGLGAPDSIMTQQHTQTLINAAIASVQTAFNTFAAHVQSGSGTAPPTVGAVTATGSSVVESEE